MKTARNCGSSKKQNIWVCLSVVYISVHVYVIIFTYNVVQWKMYHMEAPRLTDLYHHDTAGGEGLRMIPKIKFEHVSLTSFSKM